MGTSRSDSKMTPAGSAVTDEFPSTETPEFGTGVTVGSVLAFSSGEVGDGEDAVERRRRAAPLDMPEHDRAHVARAFRDAGRGRRNENRSEELVIRGLLIL